jgi:hypothetical protein
MYLPAEYQTKYAPRACGGIVIDASETGFHIYSTEDILIGTTLKIDVLFSRDYGLANFQVVAEVVWKKVGGDKRGKGYQYGLKLVQVSEEDSRTLRKLINDRFTSEEISDTLCSNF